MDGSVHSEAAAQQLLTYSFPAQADYGGLLLGALQRVESGGAIRVLEILFVARGDGPQEIAAISRRSDSSAGMIGQLIGFRLEDSARAQETEQALNGPAGDLVRELAAALEPGCAVVGLLVEHTWAHVLSDAVARTGGAPFASELLEPTEVPEAWARLPSEVSRARARE
jgi:hypothetical protein